MKAAEESAVHCRCVVCVWENGYNFPQILLNLFDVDQNKIQIRLAQSTILNPGPGPPLKGISSQRRSERPINRDHLCRCRRVSAIVWAVHSLGKQQRSPAPSPDMIFKQCSTATHLCMFKLRCITSNPCISCLSVCHIGKLKATFTMCFCLP